MREPTPPPSQWGEGTADQVAIISWLALIGGPFDCSTSITLIMCNDRIVKAIYSMLLFLVPSDEEANIENMMQVHRSISCRHEAL